MVFPTPYADHLCVIPATDSNVSATGRSLGTPLGTTVTAGPGLMVPAGCGHGQWQTYGRVWIGTSQGNLWGYDGSRWLSFEASDGTDGNAVNCIQEDDTLCLGVTNRVWSTSMASASSAKPCRCHDVISPCFLVAW